MKLMSIGAPYYKTELEEINEAFRHPAEMQMTQAERQAFVNAEKCHICGNEFGPNKVESHCPVTGEYRGPVHRHCDIKERDPVHINEGDYAAFNGATSCELCGKAFGDDKARLFDSDGVYHGAYHRTCKPKRSQQQRAKHQLKTEAQKEEFSAATVFCICNESFGPYKVRDHCHITGKYCGAAHNNCNLKLRISPYKTKVPVVFHNLRGYDGHLIIQALGGKQRQRRTIRIVKKTGELYDKTVETNTIRCIPNNMEKYMTFSVGQLQFIDSLQFMNSSMDKLAVNLPTTNLGITGQVLSNTGLDLLKREGIDPYEYVDSFERFNEPSLPPKEAFYSRLHREHISGKDYEHAQRVWTHFGCKTFADYHDLYLRTDVHLLVDIFETFPDTSMKHYGLDPAHYFSSPGMSWDALLKKTNVKLELLTDIDQHLFIEKGSVGGVCMVSMRFAKANNPMCPDYDNAKSYSWILYFDANNLYG